MFLGPPQGSTPSRTSIRSAVFAQHDRNHNAQLPWEPVWAVEAQTTPGGAANKQQDSSAGTQQVNDGVVVAGEQTDEIFEYHQKTRVDYGVCQVRL